MDKVLSSGDVSLLDSYLLVKYGPPTEISGFGKKIRNRMQLQSYLNAVTQDRCNDILDTADQTEEILNSTVPPKEWESEGRVWRQTLSRDIATRLDALNLQHSLDGLLKERQARDKGICPVRRELYSHCFDEIIRQVTMDSPDRGLLLLRIRDEIRMTLAAYHALYESAVAYGRQSADCGYRIKTELMSRIDEMEGRAEKARRSVETLRLEVDHTRRRLKERREMDYKRFSEEVQFVKRANQQLKQETDSLIDYHSSGTSMPALH